MMSDENQGEILKSQKYNLDDLPIGAYVVDREGRFIDYNRKFRQILHLPATGPVTGSITDFYREPQKRQELIDKLIDAENRGQYMEKQVVAFVVGGQEVFVQNFCRSIRNPKDNTEIIGFIGSLVDVTEEENYRRLFDSLPSGVYRLDRDDVIVHVNPAVVRMLGYNSYKELIGKPVIDLYPHPEEADKLKQVLDKKGSATGVIVELQKKTGGTIFTQVSAFKLSLPDGSYNGREGTITDVTVEEHYRRILTDVPVGFYLVQKKNGEDIIRHCNQQFAEMFEFDRVEDVLNFKVKDLYSSPEELDKLRAALEENDKIKKPLLGHIARMKTRKGKIFVIEVNSRAQHDRQENIIGRAGVIRDISDEFVLRERVKELTNDIGGVLHAYTSTLLTVQHSLRAVRSSLEPDPFGDTGYLNTDEEVGALKEPISHLASAVNKLVDLAQDQERKIALSQKNWSELSRLADVLKGIEDIPYPQFHSPTAREAAIIILEICRQVAEGKLPREVIRQVIRDAENLLRICSLITLHQAGDAVISMDHTVRSLREYVISSVRIKEKQIECTIKSLIDRTITNMDEFARNQGVNIKLKINDPWVQVKVVERDIIRALTNLLHNAIKYSWSREKGEAPRIFIRSNLLEKKILIEFENWGVPIPKEEIEQGMLFQIGHRGRLSGDRGRVGTGVGLTDSRRVAHEHGGDVTIDSRPARPEGKMDDYKQPFLTIATLSLPIFVWQGEKDEEKDTLD